MINTVRFLHGDNRHLSWNVNKESLNAADQTAEAATTCGRGGCFLRNMSRLVWGAVLYTSDLQQRRTMSVLMSVLMEWRKNNYSAEMKIRKSSCIISKSISWVLTEATVKKALVIPQLDIAWKI
ncbi:hypothetical protein RRG08_029036 [Elysia crispata]|uniref:Uncharacterized protein n=1 Tax=Elysia crispata TaxID=231223 RepID=A0AAE1AI15_9GAST|nr:hypothetical protein RRG08_029036 [Elysia crispata]